MRSVSSYLCLMLMVMFWIFRIVVAFTSSLGISFGFTPMNMNIEIILLFFTIPCMILVGKRSLIGAIIYLITYGAYFGVDVFNIIKAIMGGTATVIEYSRAAISLIGIAIPISVFFTIAVDKNRTAHPVDKKTDWFYKNDKFDRKLDSRADKNEYRNY